MKKRYITLALAAAIAFSPLAVLKAASLIGLSYGPSIDVNAGADAEVNANTSLSDDILVIKREDLDDNDHDNATSTSSSAGANARLSANENALENANENSVLVRAENIVTQDDLRAFAMASIKSDENLNSMSFTNDEIAVSYKDHGRFIGIIPITMDVNVVVDQSGNITFDYPWYGFLVAKDRADLETRVNSEVSNSLSANASGWTNYDRAELSSRIAKALKAHYEATANASSAEER